MFITYKYVPTYKGTYL